MSADSPSSPGHCPRCKAPIRRGEATIQTGYAAYLEPSGQVGGHSAFFGKCPGCGEPICAAPGGNRRWEDVDTSGIVWYVDLSNRG